MQLYKGYIKTKDKQAAQKFKGVKKFKTLDEVKNLDEYAGVLADGVILIDIDDGEQSEILMNIVEDKQLDCKVTQTSRGRHFVFKNSGVTQCYTHVKLACGLTADIKIGDHNSYQVLKFGGEERFVEWDVEPDKDYGELPKWLSRLNIERISFRWAKGKDETARYSLIFSH